MTEAQDTARYRFNLQGEIDSAALYRAMAAHEPEAKLAEVYTRLAEIEEKHAAFWRAKLSGAGIIVPHPRPGWRTRLLIWVARRFGPNLVLPAARRPSRASIEASTMISPRLAGLPCPRRSARTHASSESWRLAAGQVGTARLSRVSKADMVPAAATRCALRCSEPTTACVRI